MEKELDRVMDKITKPISRPLIYVPMDMYASNMKETAICLQRLGQKTSKDNIRRIAEAAYQKQEQRLNNLRDECVRVLSLLRDKGIVTQEEINRAVRNG
ncbi:hypothetical protein LCGC14_2328630 [marine sediment metagenome]|uniref:Uncharacterized protein n=1 Tax=marine sediment metagenome TaxID=412755 RepID=A0A0F9CG74_9ZZZZ